MADPSVSVVIPTLNAEKYLVECLEAVRGQEYDGEIEILVVDGGSTDGTLAVARDQGVDRVLPNPLRTGESGKAVGFRAAHGELILSIDSDNVVVGRDWLRRMAEPLADAAVIASEALRWDYRREDHFVTRWSALTGVGDPLALYVGNYARHSQLTGRWTGYPHAGEPVDGWLRVVLDPRWVPTLGANGFLVRRRALEVVPVRDYLFDIDFVYELARRGERTIALVDVPVRHYFCDSVGQFYGKTRRRVDDYFFFAATGHRTYPWPSRGAPVVRFTLSTVLVVPLLFDVARGMRRARDRAWFFHVAACWITLWVYGFGAIRGRLRPRMRDRAGWRQ
ncbi:MAG: glycosyltransferase family 2 protein [Thermoleophilia bacterium]|nr:glycosyltransferase family 2 protein [Thermoleophilia bacterium]